MKKTIIVLVVLFCLFAPLPVYAGGGGGGGGSAATAAALMQIFVHDAIYYALDFAEYLNMVSNAIETARNTKDQFDKMVAAEQRALKNIRGILNVRSLDDFMKWFNRQLYMQREVEARFDRMGVKIGRNTYKLQDIDELPYALRHEFVDRHDRDFTEAEKKEMMVSLGLSPSNYMYLQTWKERNKKIADEVRTFGDVYYEEIDEAARRNNATLSRYTYPNDNLDINEINKDQALIMSNIELALREGNIEENRTQQLILGLMEEGKVGPNPNRLSYHFDEDPFVPITGGRSSDSYRR